MINLIEKTTYYLDNNIVKIFMIAMIVVLGFIAPIIALILSILFSYKILSKLLNHKIFDSKMFIFAISIFFYFIVLQCVILILWLFSSNFPLTLVGPITLPILILQYYLVGIKPKLIQSKLSVIKIKDLLSIFVCFVTFILVIVAPICNSGSTGKSDAILLVNQFIDDSTHIGLLNDRIHFNRGVITNSIAEGYTQSANTDSYPASWHSANAAIIKIFYPKISTGIETVIAYVITKIFWFIFLIYIFVRTIFCLYKIHTNKEPSSSIAIWIISASLLFTGWFLVDPFIYGFYNFIPQLIVIPIFILSLIQIATLQKEDRSNLSNSLILPLALCVSAALSWLLLSPIFIVVLLISLFDIFIKLGFINTTKCFIKRIPRYLFFYLLIIIPVLIQVYLSMRPGNSSVSFLNGILMNGGAVLTYPTTFYDLILLGLVLYLLFAIRNNSWIKVKPILNYILITLAFTALLYLIQLYMVYTNLYYYFKSLDAFIIAGALSCIVGFAFAINWIEKRTSCSFAIIISIIITLLSLQFVYQKPQIFMYTKGVRVTSFETNKEIVRIFKDDYTQAKYFNKEVIIYYPDDSPSLNEIASTLLESNKPYNNCYTSLKAASFITTYEKFNVDPILNNCQDVAKITYYVNPSFVEEINKTIRDNGLNSRVIIKPIN